MNTNKAGAWRDFWKHYEASKAAREADWLVSPAQREKQRADNAARSPDRIAQYKADAAARDAYYQRCVDAWVAQGNSLAALEMPQV